jgi:hypothetical protein
MVEPRTVTGHPQRHRLSGRKIILPGKAARLSPKLRKEGRRKGAKPNQDAARCAQMEVGTIDIREGTLKFNSSGLLRMHILFMRGIRRRATGEQPEVAQLLCDEGF